MTSLETQSRLCAPHGAGARPPFSARVLPSALHQASSCLTASCLSAVCPGPPSPLVCGLRVMAFWFGWGQREPVSRWGLALGGQLEAAVCQACPCGGSALAAPVFGFHLGPQAAPADQGPGPEWRAGGTSALGIDRPRSTSFLFPKQLRRLGTSSPISEGDAQESASRVIGVGGGGAAGDPALMWPTVSSKGQVFQSRREPQLTPGWKST